MMSVLYYTYSAIAKNFGEKIGSTHRYSTHRRHSSYFAIYARHTIDTPAKMPCFHVLVPTCVFFLRAFSAREGLLVSQLTQSLYLGVPSANADRPHWSRLPFPATWDPSSTCPLWISPTIRTPAKLDTPAKRTRSSASIATRISQGKMRREARELALHQQMKAKLERAAKAAMLKLAKAAGRRAAKKIA